MLTAARLAGRVRRPEPPASLCGGIIIAPAPLVKTLPKIFCKGGFRGPAALPLAFCSGDVYHVERPDLLVRCTEKRWFSREALPAPAPGPVSPRGLQRPGVCTDAHAGTNRRTYAGTDRGAYTGTRAGAHS